MFGFKKRVTPSRSVAPKTRNLVAQGGSTLLSTEYRQNLIVKMRRASSVTDKVFQDHYYFALNRAAEFAQAFPASANHHHAHEGGLLDHMLEVAYNATRVCRGFIMPPNAQPEDITKHEEKWRYAAFLAALAHDLGKLIADIETVYRPSKANDTSYMNWHPWYGPMPVGSEYIYRFQAKKGTNHRGLHEQLSATLLPYLITPSASTWIRSDRALMAQLMATVTQSSHYGGVINEIVKKSDHASTGANLGADTGTSSATVPNHQKLMTALKLLATNGTLKRNNPGSAVWVTENATWFSFKPSIEAARQHLVEEGHSGIPQSEHRLIQLLNEHQHTIMPTSGDATWQAVVEDTKRKGWKVKLSFFVIPNESIWAGGVPAIFDGKVTPSDGKGNPLLIETLPDLLKPVEVPNDGEANHIDGDQTPATDTTSPIAATKPDGLDMSAHVPSSEPRTQRKARKEETDHVQLEDHKKPKGRYSAGASDVTMNSHFYEWVARNVFYRKLRYNEPEALVHAMGDFIVLPTPAIFNAYLQHADNKTEKMALGASPTAQLKALQKAVRSTNAHKRAKNGTDFHKITVTGPRNASEFTALLVERRKLPQIAHIATNNALSLA